MLKLIFLLLPFLGFAAQEDFDLLMGKDTPAWEHCKTAEDCRRLEFFKGLFQKNIYLEPAEEAKIPKVIHFIWLGPDGFPKEYALQVRKWIELHPDWRFKFWTNIDQSLPHPKMEMVFTPNDMSRPFYESLKLREKAKILAFEILFSEGGLYVDPQTTPFRSFDLFHEQYDFFCGLKTLGPTTLSSSVLPATHLIAAKPGHPILQNARNYLERHWDLLATPTRAFAEGIDFGINQDESADIIFPASYFSGKHRKASSFATHFPMAQVSYTPFERKVEDKFQKMIQKENEEIRLIAGLIAISLLGLIALIIYARRKA